LTNQAQILRGRVRPGTRDDFAKDERPGKPRWLQDLDLAWKIPDSTTAAARRVRKGYHKMQVQARKAKEAKC
jgi:hypothetical protein